MQHFEVAEAMFSKIKKSETEWHKHIAELFVSSENLPSEEDSWFPHTCISTPHQRASIQVTQARNCTLRQCRD
jgi:hypothetical protein